MVPQSVAPGEALHNSTHSGEACLCPVSGRDCAAQDVSESAEGGFRTPNVTAHLGFHTFLRPPRSTLQQPLAVWDYPLGSSSIPDDQGAYGGSCPPANDARGPNGITCVVAADTKSPIPDPFWNRLSVQESSSVVTQGNKRNTRPKKTDRQAPRVYRCDDGGQVPPVTEITGVAPLLSSKRKRVLPKRYVTDSPLAVKTKAKRKGKAARVTTRLRRQLSDTTNVILPGPSPDADPGSLSDRYHHRYTGWSSDDGLPSLPLCLLADLPSLESSDLDAVGLSLPAMALDSTALDSMAAEPAGEQQLLAALTPRPTEDTSPRQCSPFDRTPGFWTQRSESIGAIESANDQTSFNEHIMQPLSDRGYSYLEESHCAQPLSQECQEWMLPKCTVEEPPVPVAFAFANEAEAMCCERQTLELGRRLPRGMSSGGHGDSVSLAPFTPLLQPPLKQLGQPASC